MSQNSGWPKSDGPVKPRKMLYGANMLKHVLKKGGREGAELRIDDLDETVLQARYDRLDHSLAIFLTNL